jgi:hypothetical protein
MIIGIANYDIQKEMINNSLKASPSKTPADYTFEILLMQKSFCPLLPSAVNSEEYDKIEKSLNIDYRKLSSLEMPAIPDIIITNSSYATIAKKIHNTLFINPGSLFKGNNVGGLAKIALFPPSVRLFF